MAHKTNPHGSVVPDGSQFEDIRCLIARPNRQKEIAVNPVTIRRLPEEA